MTEMTDKTDMIAGRTRAAWIDDFPLISELAAMRELSWFNPEIAGTAEEGIADVGLTEADIRDASARLKRFAPYIRSVFPETSVSAGIIESPIAAVPNLASVIGERKGVQMPGSMWAKLDSHLPISGSIKARGGIYEVLKHAEEIALKHELITLDSDYSVLDSDEAREVFGRYRVAVGSTGNLGLSIGIMSAKLGFKASVHMSADARQLKKDRLRSHGVEVVEYESDYSIAVAAGRKQAESDETIYFVDDENSKSLFLGYAVSGHRLAGQLQAMEVQVDADHPLFVYLPCGVGGGPGGVAFGLKVEFGDAVRCIFTEPTHCPSMLLGVHTGAHEALAVQDFGIDNVTAADGLACGRPSGFVGQAMGRLIDGFYTVDDDEMYRLVAEADGAEGLKMEPSSATSLLGPVHVMANAEYRERIGINDETFANATHLSWITGGNMVPEDEMASYIVKGNSLL